MKKMHVEKYVVDTNVPLTANNASHPDSIPFELCDCVEKCIDEIERIKKYGGIVIDDGREIFEEYCHKLSFSGQPGIGDSFLKWIHDHQGYADKVEFITIHKEGDSYREFPNHPGLARFDISDRKFVAVANAHQEKPPILQATDSKWWGWKDALSEVGITVQFLCIDYMKKKFEKKMS